MQIYDLKVAKVELPCCQDDSSFNNRLSGCFVLWQFAKPVAINQTNAWNDLHILFH